MKKILSIVLLAGVLFVYNAPKNKEVKGSAMENMDEIIHIKDIETIKEGKSVYKNISTKQSRFYINLQQLL